MIGEIKEVSAEPQALPLGELEALADREVEILLRRSDEAPFDATLGGAVAAGKAGSKRRSREVRAAKGEGAAAGRIDGREGQTGLQCENSTGLPAAEGRADEAGGVGEEGKLVDEAGNEAMAAIEIGEAAGIPRVELIVQARVKSNRRSGDVVDRF